MPRETACLSKFKYFLPVALCHLSPVVHSEYVLTRQTKDKLHREGLSLGRLLDALYLSKAMPQKRTN